MKHVLIRDDDLCYFSQPERVDEIYGFALDAGLPVNFSVIPKVDANARTNSRDFGPGTFEPFIPREYQGREECFSVLDNPALTRYLRGAPAVEILQHGFCHGGAPGRYEFELPDRSSAAEKLRAGSAILQEAFGATPTTFVAPQDKYSRASFHEILRKFQIFSLGWLDRTRLPATVLPAYAWMKVRGRNVLRSGGASCIEHPGVIFSKFKNTEVELQRFHAYMEDHPVTVLVLHHWEFYDDGRLNRGLHAKFKDTVNALADSGQCAFLNFRDIHQVLN
ncbi:MAG: DUF2334 domain-containing protein [Candidatus Hydrogenedentes bacterium]|nr:DUF2334 domain-containing protein [Candidatus Hydrogenedentota bacterium]